MGKSKSSKKSKGNLNSNVKNEYLKNTKFKNASYNATRKNVRRGF